MRYDLANPWNPHSDRLVLSEGHAVPIVYAAYADLGGVVGTDPSDARKLTLDDLMGLREIESVLDGHPNPAVGFPFFDAATGSLGQGISVAGGLGLAARLDGSDRTVYVLCGDGESREGQIWEALDFIADHCLANVRIIFNCNGMGQSDYVSPQQSPEVLARKIEAYGLHPVTIDGHDPEAISKALSLDPPDGKPVAVVAKTVKGWGVPELQVVGYHGKPLSAEAAEKALQDLALPPAPPDIDLCPAMPKGEIPKADRGPIRMPDPDFAALASDQKKLADSVAKGELATRHAYGLTLRALGEASERIVALDGDVSNSTFSRFFAERFPDRFFECRIAEQNMCSMAAGLAAAGKVPFANSFAKFLVRAYDQIEMAAYTCANLKLVGSHSGVTLASVTTPKGQSGAVVLNPCDAVSAYKLAVAMANYEGLAYMRTLRSATSFVYEPGECGRSAPPPRSCTSRASRSTWSARRCWPRAATWPSSRGGTWCTRPARRPRPWPRTASPAASSMLTACRWARTSSGSPERRTACRSWSSRTITLGAWVRRWRWRPAAAAASASMR